MWGIDFSLDSHLNFQPVPLEPEPDTNNDVIYAALGSERLIRARRQGQPRRPEPAYKLQNDPVTEQTTSGRLQKFITALIISFTPEEMLSQNCQIPGIGRTFFGLTVRIGSLLFYNSPDL